MIRMSLLALLLSTTAHAGKLADGFRGLPFGDAKVLATAPDAACSPNPEPTIRWRCTTEIGGVTVLTNYVVNEGLFTSVFIVAEGFTNKEKLLTVMTQAWGPGRDGAPKLVRTWREGSVAASFDYNRYSKLAQVLLFDLDVYEQAQLRAAEKAKSAVGDL